MIRKVVLPAAGLGTRLRPLTAALPKEMLPVGRRLVIQHVLEECDRAGLDQVLAIISRRKLALLDGLEPDETVLDDLQVPRRLVYSTLQHVQGGLGHALLHAEGFVGPESFAMALPDTLLTGGEVPILQRLISVHKEHAAGATVAVEEVSVERASRYGILTPAPGEDTTDTFRVVDVVEKPPPGTEPSRLAISARYLFSPAIFPALRELKLPPNGELRLTDAIRSLAQNGLPVVGVRLSPGEQRWDIGSLDSYQEAIEALGARY